MSDTRGAVLALILLAVALVAGWAARAADAVSITTAVPADPGVVVCGSPASATARLCIDKDALCAEVGPDGAVMRLWGRRADGVCAREDAP